MTQLTEQQKQSWSLFEHIRLQRKARPDNLDAMQAVVREFALLLIEQDLNQSAIVVSGQTLITFPNENYSSKAAYIARHRNNYVWGEDPILFTALDALGYQPVMHLVGTHLPPYVPFEQRATRRPLTIHILNHGAARGGYHWELQGERNPGAGNCMYYTVAQRIQRDLPKINPTVPAELKEIIAAKPTAVKHSFADQHDFASKSQTEPKNDLAPIAANDVSAEIIAASIKHAQIHTDAFEAMKQQLTALNPSQLSTEQLIQYYRELRDTVNDTYLKGRLKEISKERGDESIEAVVNGILPIDAVDEGALRAELLHALARESSLRDSSYDYLSARLDPLLKIKAKPADASQEASKGTAMGIARQVWNFFRKEKPASSCKQEAAAENRSSFSPTKNELRRVYSIAPTRL